MNILELAEAQGCADDSVKLPGAGIYTTIRELYEKASDGLGYIIKGRSVWAVCYTPQKGFYSRRLYTKPAGGVPLALPGRYHWADRALAYKMMER